MKAGLIICFICFVLLRCPGGALADTAWLVTPSAGYHLLDSDLGLDSGPQGGVRVAYSIIGNNVSESIEVEGAVDYLSTRTKSAADDKADVILARVSALYPFLPKKRIVPYLALGGGGMFVSGQGGSEQNPFLTYGVTVRYYLTEWLALGVDARNTLIYKDGFQPGFEGGVGLTFVVGGERKFKRVPAAKSSVTPKAGPAIRRLDELEGGDRKKIP